MSRCVPDWDLSDPPPASAAGTPSFHLSSAAPGVVPMFEYEVAELTWENGQLAMHGLGFPRQTGKILGGAGGDGGSKYTWDNKPVRASGTLESLVNQGTGKGKMIGFDVTTGDNGGGKDLVPWLSDHHRPTPQSSTASAAMTMDAMVPSNGDTAAEGWAGEAAAAESSDNHVAARVDDERGRTLHERRGREAARVVHATREWSSCRNKISVNGSAATIGREIGQKATLNTRERDFATATTATSQGSLDDTNSGKPSTKTTTTDEDRDSVCHSTHQVEAEDGGDREKESPKSSISTKRSRAAATHNLSERKRRDRINDRMKTLQKLVPNSSKTDKASMLDEVIEYLKQMQAQVNMMSRINMPMMLPVAMQQQQQLPLASMMAPVGLASMGMSGMGMGVGLGMDHWNMIANRSGLAPGMSPLGFHPTAFMPVVTWDGSTCNQLQPSPTTMMADPLSTFHAYQSQPMTMEAYNRIALMFQQLHQHPPTTNGPNN